MNHQQKSERDELRARFTVWLETTVYRARLKYLEREKPKVDTVSIEELPESALSVFKQTSYCEISGSAFDFEEERLAEAFAKLPIKRQEILTMLFVEERKPEEIARLLNCSPQHVYDQRYQALKKLRIALTRMVINFESHRI